MAEIKYGIEKLQPALISAIKAGETTFNALKDGFQWLQDLMALIRVGSDIQAIFKDQKDLLNEAMDVDTEEGAKLNAAIAKEFNWTSAKAARKIKAGFNLIWAAIYFGDEWNEPDGEKAPGL